MLACLGLFATCTRETARPNILLISIDTLRADHLGCYGYKRDTSSVIDALARQGTVFESAWSVTSWTLPAHVSMLTGLPISAHAQCDWDLEATQRVASHLPRGRFVSEDLSRAGYDCAGFFSAIYLESKFGFGPGFSTWERAYHSFQSEPGIAEQWKSARKSNDVDTLRRIHSEHPELFDEEVRTDPVAVDAAMHWLEKRADDHDPFFLFLHIYDVYSPYTPPAPFDTRFDPDYKGSVDGRRLGEVDSPVHVGMDPRDLEHVIALYDGEIAGVDRELARLFEALERSGAAKNTLMIVTADHGEESFEHGGKQHGVNLYRETLQVPLIVKWPGHVPSGARERATVGLIDLVPTLRAAAGLQPDNLLPGLDLLRLSEPNSQVNSRTLSASLVIRRGVEEPIWMSSLIDSREQVIVRRPSADNWSAESFDLTTDPRERGSAQPFDSASPQAAALIERMQAKRSQLQRIRELAPPRDREGVPLSPPEQAHLESLGYGGTPKGESYAGERLCFDGCIWHP